MVLALLTFYNIGMADNNTQELPVNEPTQESNYTAYEQLEDMSPSLAIVREFLNQIYNENQYLNKSVTVENVSVISTKQKTPI